MGLPGVSFTPGLHICAFFRGPSQRDELLLPYLREGLAAGDKCICVTDDPAAGAAVCALAGEFGSAAPAQLQPMDSASTYLSGGGCGVEKGSWVWVLRVDAGVAE